MKKFMLILVALSLLACTSATAQRNQGYTYHAVQVVDDNGNNVTDITTVTIYLPDTTTQQTIYKDRGISQAITQPMTTSSTNTTLVNGYFTWWGAATYDFTIGNGTVTATNASTAARNASQGRIVFPYYLQTVSSVSLTDAQSTTYGTDSDWVVAGGATADRLTLTPGSDGATLYLGSTSNQADITLWGSATDYTWWDESIHTLFAVSAEWVLDDNSSLWLGSSSDVEIRFDGTDMDILLDDQLVNFGADGAGNDIYIYSETAGDNAYFDEDNAELLLTDYDLQLDDDALLIFGSGDDWTMYSDTADTLELDPGAAGDTLKIGTANTDAANVIWYSDTSGDTVTFDEENVMVEFEDVSIALGDATSILFGDTIGTGDLSISSTSAVLSILQVVADTGTIAVGVDGNGIDTTFYGETAGDYMKWDEDGSTNGALVFEDAIVHMMDDTTIVFGDGSDATIMYDEDGVDALQITGVVGGSRALIENVSADDTLTLTTDLSGKVFVIDGNTVTVTLTLPSVAAAQDGWSYTFYDANATAASDVLIAPASGDTVGGDSAGFDTVGSNDEVASLTIMYDHSNTDWIVINNSSVTAGTWLGAT